MEPYPTLNRIAVFDNAGNIFSELFNDFVVFLRTVLEEFLIARDDIIDVTDIDKAVSVNSGHMVVDLGDYNRRFFHGRLGDIHAEAETHVAVSVRW